MTFSDKSKRFVYIRAYRDSYDIPSSKNNDRYIILKEIVTEIKNRFDSLIVDIKTKKRLQASKMALW